MQLESSIFGSGGLRVKLREFLLGEMNEFNENFLKGENGGSVKVTNYCRKYYR